MSHWQCATYLNVINMKKITEEINFHDSIACISVISGSNEVISRSAFVVSDNFSLRRFWVIEILIADWRGHKLVLSYWLLKIFYVKSCLSFLFGWFLKQSIITIIILIFFVRWTWGIFFIEKTSSAAEDFLSNKWIFEWCQIGSDSFKWRKEKRFYPN